MDQPAAKKSKGEKERSIDSAVNLILKKILICGICLAPFKGVELTIYACLNGHLFCGDCKHRLKMDSVFNSACPTCKEIGPILRSGPLTEIAEVLHNAMPFQCTVEGCEKDFTTQRHLSDHLKSCPFVLDTCVGCGLVTQRKLLFNHLREKRCNELIRLPMEMNFGFLEAIFTLRECFSEYGDYPKRRSADLAPPASINLKKQYILLVHVEEVKNSSSYYKMSIRVLAYSGDLEPELETTEANLDIYNRLDTSYSSKYRLQVNDDKGVVLRSNEIRPLLGVDSFENIAVKVYIKHQS